MRYIFRVLCLLVWSVTVTPAMAQLSIGIGFPGVSIGINLPLFPELVRIPGYPVYYAPRVNSNFFFYDGMYWVYQNDNWYASSWYNGPWGLVAPEVVPLYVLRIPVRYYQSPPEYFRGWRPDAPPRWGDHWGNDWAQHRGGWDKWNRRSAPAPAPLPVYQRQYSGERYPQQIEQQRDLRNQNYKYQPRDALVKQREPRPEVQKAPAPSAPSRPAQLSAPVAPRQQAAHPTGEPAQRPAPIEGPSRQKAPAVQEQKPQAHPPAIQEQKQQPRQPAIQEQKQQPRQPAIQEQKQQPRQAPAQHEQQAPASSQGNGPRDRGREQETGRGQGQGQGQGQDNEREPGEGRGQGRNK